MENRSVTAAKATGDSKGDPVSTAEHASNGPSVFALPARQAGRAEKLKSVFAGRRPSRLSLVQ